MNLKELGWNEFHEKNYNETKTQKSFPARVAKAEREKYLIYSDFGEVRAEIKGRIRFDAQSAADFPVVGDWVIAEMRPEGDAAIIIEILPRMSKLSRKVPGSKTDEQVLVSNIDTVFLVSGLDDDFNIRRIERFLTLAFESNSKPVIVLNKTDVCVTIQERLAEVEAVAFGVPVVTLSALNDEGVEKVRKYIVKESTIAFLGSSGVGKSTIINRLLGEERQKVGAVREHDSRGRHITTRRELLLLPEGGIVIDNPGLRELQLWANEEALDNTFSDVMEIMAHCRFKDCTHLNEPGCAVRDAIESGQLDSKRLEGYIKLKKELKYLATRKEIKSRNAKVIFEKKISKLSKQITEHRSRNGIK